LNYLLNLLECFALGILKGVGACTTKIYVYNTMVLVGMFLFACLGVLLLLWMFNS
jgi:hypothetical protein